MVPSLLVTIGPDGRVVLVSISSGLSFGSILTNRACPSLNQVIGFPRLALALASVSLFAVRVVRSTTQTSTPLGVVWVKAILVSSGLQAKFASLGFSGNPLIGSRFLSLNFLYFRLFT